MVKLQKNNNFIKNRMNYQIDSSLVRIINAKDFNLSLSTPISIQQALDLKNEFETDLIEITYNEKENSSICKLIDKDKFVYQEKKKEKERKQNQKIADLKEIKLGVDIAENDINTKHNQAIKFLEKGDNVKITLQLKGRQAFMQTSKDKALELILKFADNLNTVGKIVNMPVWNNNKLTMQVNKK